MYGEGATHMRKVLAGIDGSSVLETAARTSGYGESSSMSLHMRWESMDITLARNTTGEVEKDRPT